MARLLCRLFGHVRKTLLIEEYHVRGFNPILVIERCPRCGAVTGQYEAPF